MSVVNTQGFFRRRDAVLCQSAVTPVTHIQHLANNFQITKTISLRTERLRAVSLRHRQGAQINCSSESSRWLTAISFTYGMSALSCYMIFCVDNKISCRHN